jgi:integrase
MKVQLYLKQNEVNNEGEKRIYIRLRKTSKERKRTEARIKTEIYVLGKYFNDGTLSTRTPRYADYNSILSATVSEIYRIIAEIKEEGLEPNPSLVRKRYYERLVSKEEITPKAATFWDCFEEFCKTKRNKSRGYLKTLKTLKNRLQDYEGFNNSKITFNLIIGKPSYFKDELVNFFWEKKNLSNGYINKLLANLSNFLHYANYNGYINKKPKLTRIADIDRDEKVYLKVDEVQRLFNDCTEWDYLDEKDFSKNPHIVLKTQERWYHTRDKYGSQLIVTNWELVKDIMLFLCAVGCRFGDIKNFKVRDFSFEKDESFFEIIQAKGKNRVIVPVNDVSSHIFRKYSRGKTYEQPLFPPISLAKFNKQIKLVLRYFKFNRLVSRPKMKGSKIVDGEDRFLWELISSHAGRRSFAKNLVEIGTMDYKTAMKLTGHKTYSQFEKYLSVDKADKLKAGQLYRQKDKELDITETELLDVISKINKEEDRKLLLQTAKRFLN